MNMKRKHAAAGLAAAWPFWLLAFGLAAAAPVTAQRPALPDSAAATDSVHQYSGAEAETETAGADAGRDLPPPVARLRAQLAADVAADSVGSVVGAVVIGDSVVWSEAFGTAGPRAARRATIYRVGSLTKAFTAVVLMRLVERGVIRLDDAVETHLPELRHLADRSPDHRAITWRDLATHTAGLDREPFASHAGRGGFRGWKRKLVAAIPTTRVRNAPGEAYRYSNIGYAILGFALERASGIPYEWLLQEEVFDRIGMTGSSLVVPAARAPRLAPGYVNLAGNTADPRVPRAEHRGRGYRVPGEGAYTTADDLARFIMAISGALGDTLLTTDSRAEMLRVQTPGDPRAGYGLGFQITDLGASNLAGHSGSLAGYAAYMVFDPATRVGVVLLRNYNFGDTNLAAEAQRVVLDLGGL